MVELRVLRDVCEGVIDVDGNAGGVVMGSGNRFKSASAYTVASIASFGLRPGDHDNYDN